MKNLFSSFALLILLVPKTQAQTVALDLNPVNEKFTYSSIANFDSYHRGHNRKVLVGGIVAASGGLFFISGVFIFAAGAESEDGTPPQTSLQTLGLGLMIAGAATAIIGGVIAINGHNDKKRRYGIKMASPKNNEIGLAYNF